MTAPDATDRTLPPIEVRNLDHAKHLKFYRNGDRNFPGHNFRWNKRHFRTFDAFLGAITQGVKLESGAVRRIYTPNHGSRINDFSELEEGGCYVAASQERFKRLKGLKYTDIQKTPRRQPRYNYLEIPKKNKRYQDVSGKIHQMNTQARKIFVWPNKETVYGPDPITLHPYQLEDMQKVIDQVDDRLKTKCGRCIASLHTRDGKIIRDPKDLIQDECYVAVPHRDRFQRVYYKEKPLPNFACSKRLEKYRELPPLNLSRGSKNSKGWSPDHSGPSSNPTSENSYRHQYWKNQHYRNSREHREEDEVFPRKPVTHKRSSERKQHREIDLDRDDGGVFKSKQNNRYTQGAREIRDTDDTQVDLPIDQVPAEEVKEEEQGVYESSDDKNAPVPSGVELTKLPSEQTSEDANDEDEEERIRRKPNSDNNSNNSRTPPKHKSKANRGINGYDDRIDSPQRNSPSPRYSPERRRSPTPKHSPLQSPSPRHGHSGRRSSQHNSPDQNNHNFQEEEEAAVKIQAHFRGYQARKEMNNHGRHSNKSFHDDRDVDDFLQSEKERAATKIQSHYRGYRARKNYYERKASRVMSAGRVTNRSQRESNRSREDDFEDPGRIDLENAAATTIQAGFRGYRDRKMLKSQR